MPTISYAITVCDEIDEIKTLLNFLLEVIRNEDEIVVLMDLDKGTSEVKEYLDHFNIETEYKKIQFHRIFKHLNKDFASFKNFLKEHCSKEYIFFIDADEILPSSFVEALPIILEQNNEIDLFEIPRINKVNNITEEHIKRWGWRINERDFINWPDYQTRIMKNNERLKWEGKVHERIGGYLAVSKFPDNINTPYHLLHLKDIKKQEQQNQFYNTI